MRALPIYAASKSAVTQITECLYGQLAAVSDRVHASVLFPGPRALNTGLWSAERNRPAELAARRPRTPQTFEGMKEAIAALGGTVSETPLDEVAATVVQGIREERFWILPESENTDATIRRRAASMLGRSNPDYMIDHLPVAAGGLGEPEA